MMKTALKKGEVWGARAPSVKILGLKGGNVYYIGTTIDGQPLNKKRVEGFMVRYRKFK
jgi:hypothetical protein